MAHHFIKQLQARVANDQNDSDVACYYALMHFGEATLKLIVLGLSAAIQQNREKHGYRQLYELIRADGLGRWREVLFEILDGPAALHLQPSAHREQHAISSRVKEGAWQHTALARLTSAYGKATGNLTVPDYSGQKVSLREWFTLFVRLRNDTRAHGAQPPSVLAAACEDLRASITLVVENLEIFSRPWVYLHHNLNGKYRVSPITEQIGPFEDFKKSTAFNVRNGVYISFDHPTLVPLLESDAELTDFYLANGGMTNRKYELISYVSGDKLEKPPTEYLEPADTLKESGTQGRGQLDSVGKCWTNLPPSPDRYVHRRVLEKRLVTELTDTRRHPIVTLTGPGGIGKTSLALRVLHELLVPDPPCYEMVVWFSARDIDLLERGPRQVSPHVLTIKDVALEWKTLVGSTGTESKSPEDLLADAMREPQLGGPTLFVFDNFETIQSPVEMFQWLDSRIAPPNKILITSRSRDFSGDVPVEVGGMTEDEAHALLLETAQTLHIEHLLTSEYASKIVEESAGHPYVMKILLSEAAREGRVVEPRRIVAGKEDILRALFERTWQQMSPGAQRTFLVLASWRSTVPELALSAVLLRKENERFDVEEAIRDLKRVSFIEEQRTKDGGYLLGLTLAAQEFGRRKLAVHPDRLSIEVDTKVLQEFGVGKRGDITQGLSFRIEKLFQNLAAKSSESREVLEKWHEILEFLARGFPPAWLSIARLYEELGERKDLDKAKDALRSYLEVVGTSKEATEAWRRIAAISFTLTDVEREIHALVEMVQDPEVTIVELSRAASRINEALRGFNPDIELKQGWVRGIIGVLERRFRELDATDCSRLAWLHLKVHNEARALEVARAGLAMDPENYYCLSLVERLTAKG